MTEIILPEPEPTPSSYTPSEAELQFNRKSTKAFIDSDPVHLSLGRTNRVELPDGGYSETPLPAVPSQVFRLIPQTDVMPQVQTPDGTVLTPGYVLLGEWNCDMKRWDTFTLNGHDFQIVSPIRPLHTDRAYEKKGDVALR